MARPANAGSGPLRLVLATSAAMATLGNWPLWQALADLGLLQSAKGWGLAVALAVAVFAALVALQSLLAWRYSLKPAAIFLLLATAAGAHFMLAYRIVIDQTMLVNVLQTNPGEAADLLSLRMLATLLLGGVLPAWLVWRMPVQHARWPRQLWRNLLATLAALALLVVAVLASFQPLSSTMRNHKQLRYLINPLNAVYGLGMVASEPLRRNDRVLLPLGTDARLGPGAAAAGLAQRPPLLLLVLGETARAANFSLNGYDRPTNPALAKLPVISWRNAWSCGTNTAASVPCMFSHLGRDAYASRDANHENLLDVAQRAGLAVLWLDNQSGCKGVCARVPNVDTSALQHPSLCAGGECGDPVMLEDLDARIAALPAERARPRRAAGDAPDGQPRPGVLQAGAAGLQALPARMQQQRAAGLQPRRSWSMPTTTPSPTPTISWPRPSAGCSSARPATTAPCCMCPTTANRWARTTSTCTACPMPWRPMCRSGCPGSPG